MATKRNEVAPAPETVPAPEDTISINPNELKEFIATESFESFARRHGEFVVIGDASESLRTGDFNEYLQFENGARARTNHPLRHGGQEPPADPVENAKARGIFVATKLQREEDALAQFVKAVFEQSQLCLTCECPPPPKDWREQRDRGRQRVAGWREKFDQIERWLDANDPQRIEKRNRQTAVEERHAERRKLHEEIIRECGPNEQDARSEAAFKFLNSLIQ